MKSFSDRNPKDQPQLPSSSISFYLDCFSDRNPKDQPQHKYITKFRFDKDFHEDIPGANRLFYAFGRFFVSKMSKNI